MNQEAAIGETINLYKNVGWKKWFSKWRFAMAPYIEVEKNLPKNGKVIELGCGEGIFSNYVAISEKKRKVIGYEINNERIKEANRGVTNVVFQKADITKLAIPNNEAIVTFHVLHHLTSYDQQEELIGKISKSMKKNGKLIIVEVNAKFSLKFMTAWLFDHFIVPIVFEGRLYDNIYFREKADWKKLLQKEGFTVKITEAEKGMIFPHIILYCTKLHIS